MEIILNREIDVRKLISSKWALKDIPTMASSDSINSPDSDGVFKIYWISGPSLPHCGRRGVTMFFDVVIADAHFLEQEGMFSPHFEAREPGRARPMETSPLHPISLPFKVISAPLWDQIPMALSIFWLTNFYSTVGK